MLMWYVDGMVILVRRVWSVLYETAMQLARKRASCRNVNMFASEFSSVFMQRVFIRLLLISPPSCFATPCI